MESEDLDKKIAEKEKQLSRAEQESKAWNSGKLKHSSNADISKKYVESLKRELANLYEERKALQN